MCRDDGNSSSAHSQDCIFRVGRRRRTGRAGARVSRSLPRNRRSPSRPHVDAPGWSPALLYGGDLVRFSLFPYKLVGYLALSYLVFVTLLDVNGSALSGALGFASCVSCTWPILGTAVTALFGGGSILATVATNQPYGLSTFVFATSVGLLVWRPFTNLRGWLPEY